MLGTGIVAYFVLLAIEYGAIKLIKSFIFSFIPRTYSTEMAELVDSDVRAEKERIDQMDLNDLKSETMVMQNVSKFYGNFCAVNQISLSLKR